MTTPAPDPALHRELRVRRALLEFVRAELSGVREGGQRSVATIAVAAAAAEETHRITDRVPDLQNDTSRMWRIVLQQVWDFLEGDGSQYYALSRAVGEFLLSPLNHHEGQDGPDDFDRPQTVASYEAALAVTVGGVDFAGNAVRQIFEAIDMAYDGDNESAERWAEVQAEVKLARRIVGTAVAGVKQQGPRLTVDVLASLRA